MKILYFAWIKDKTGKSYEYIDSSKVKDIKALKKFLKDKYPDLVNFINQKQVLRFAVNFEYTKKNNKLSKKDEVAIFPPVSGG